jgi:hypothetical protein
VAIISDTDLGTLDAQLGARPAGPGRLFFWLSDRSELVRVDAEGPRLIEPNHATPAETPPKVSTDAKQIEIGLTDKADSARRLFSELWRRGIGPGLVLIGGGEFAPLDGPLGSDSHCSSLRPGGRPRCRSARSRARCPTMW